MHIAIIKTKLGTIFHVDFQTVKGFDAFLRCNYGFAWAYLISEAGEIIKKVEGTCSAKN